MPDLITQIFILARGDDQGWINLLIPVVVAIFWGINALVTAKKNKKGPAKPPGTAQGPRPGQQQRLGQRPGQTPQRPASSSRGVQSPAGGPTIIRPPETRPSQTPPKPPRRPMPRPAAPTDGWRPSQPAITSVVDSSVMPSLTPVSKPTATLSQLQQILPPSKPKSDIAAETPTLGTVDSSSIDEIVSAYDDHDLLRLAILHCEILGAPISMRDSDGSIIGP